MKRTIILIYLAFGGLIQHTKAQTYGWVDISANIPGDSLFHDLTDLHFISNTEGWIVSSSHKEIYHTTDGGQTFKVQTIAQPNNAIRMLNADTGYVGGMSSLIYRTTNGGDSWTFHGIFSGTLTDINFPPSGGTGYACGFNGAIYSINTSGTAVMTSGVNGNLNGISFPVSSAEGWVCGSGSVIRHYTNGAWKADQANISGGWNAICFVDNQKGWTIGNKIIHTTDGQNWIEQTNPDTLGRTLLNVFFLNENEGWIVGNQGLILHSTNEGTTWTVEANGFTSNLLTRVQFTSTTNGYVIGNNKTLLKFTRLASIEENEMTSEINIYPNPTDAIIKLEIPYYQKVEIVIISDMTGREVIRKNNLFINEINLESLHKGFYSIQIVTNKQKYYGKIIKQ